MQNNRQDKTQLQQAIVNVLHYFDVFHFPLRFEEIHQFIQQNCDEQQLVIALNDLVSQQEIYQLNDCYSLHNNQELVARKNVGFQLAQQKIYRAKKIGKFIQCFPFVRMVAISGSLSKGYADQHSDIDFFIVTNATNLWTSRTLLHVFKKLTFLVGQQHSFCMNYFIAESHLSIEEQNYFTAIELATLITVTHPELGAKLVVTNEWITEFLPNHNPPTTQKIKVKTNIFKRIIEFVLGSKKLNHFFMELTNNKWRKKWARKNFPMEAYDLAFKTRLYVSKNHDKNYQEKILKKYEDKTNSNR
jgi:predicted nucleotidyltransferase